MRLTIDLETCIIHVWPKFDRVVFISKWSGQSESSQIGEFCVCLERVAEIKRKETK